MPSIKQTFEVGFKYKVHFTRKVFSQENKILLETLTSKKSSAGSDKAMVVIDRGVIDHHPDLISKIDAYFAENDGRIHKCEETLIVPGGEEVKNTSDWTQLVLAKINEFKIDRHSYVLAIGGGAVLDMVGFAASIAHRGIRLIRMPTTVLSQNDSGVGVKNGINLFGKKNFIGSFSTPHAVISDFEFLKTLDERDWISGIAEAIKVALIKDRGFFKFLEAKTVSLNKRDEKTIEEVIIRCAEIHMDHISSGDPFEEGSSRPLDFGHWAAHKLEQISNYDLRHGEAVAIGICLDCTYSFLKGWLAETKWRRIISLFQALNFEIYSQHLVETGDDNRLYVLGGLEEFREHLGGELTIMMLKNIGTGKEVNKIDQDKMIEAIAHLEKSQNFSTSTS